MNGGLGGEAMAALPEEIILAQNAEKAGKYIAGLIGKCRQRPRTWDLDAKAAAFNRLEAAEGTLTALGISFTHLYRGGKIYGIRIGGKDYWAE